MLLLPDPKILDAYPTDPKNGGPWVMWKGTLCAHIMVPLSPTRTALVQPQWLTFLYWNRAAARWAPAVVNAEYTLLEPTAFVRIYVIL